MTEQHPFPRTSEVTKTGGLLAAILLHNLVYPMSTWGGIAPAAFYVLYASMFVIAAWLLTGDARLRMAATISGLAVFAAGLANSYMPSSGTALAVYVTSIVYHAIALIVLTRYTFTSRQVFTEVVLAATCLYLVLGSAFAAIYGLIFWVDSAAFTSATGGAVGWQQLLYYSYVTLTTLGYGDVLPVGHVAQSVAAFQAIVGTLYTVLLLSRLVGMHSSARA
ncbi:potassium channel family protein [Cognatishimia sp. MH4019]|uniref:potassium channel family protein n=1 Tax=Cognatishimia sp. MH4019 TaxID=2854030 RepID=UPI001CD691C5|nr:potassium channel family protein [Cognatishimia sp. MH4019]